MKPIQDPLLLPATATQLHRESPPGRRCALIPVAVLLLAGCAGSPPAQYYTLAANTVATAPAEPSAIAVEFTPITVPQQVDQPQLMLRTAPLELTPDYNARWAAALGDEIRSGLSAALSERAGITDVTALGGTRTGPLWRLQVQVQTFDLPVGGPATLEALWRARRLDDPKTAAWLCRGQFRTAAAGPGILALVDAQRQSLDGLAQQIAGVLAGEPSPDCRREAPPQASGNATP